MPAQPATILQQANSKNPIVKKTDIFAGKAKAKSKGKKAAFEQIAKFDTNNSIAKASENQQNEVTKEKQKAGNSLILPYPTNKIALQPSFITYKEDICEITQETARKIRDQVRDGKFSTQTSP